MRGEGGEGEKGGPTLYATSPSPGKVPPGFPAQALALRETLERAGAQQVPWRGRSRAWRAGRVRGRVRFGLGLEVGVGFGEEDAEGKWKGKGKGQG